MVDLTIWGLKIRGAATTGIAILLASTQEQAQEMADFHNAKFLDPRESAFASYDVVPVPIEEAIRLLTKHTGGAKSDRATEDQPTGAERTAAEGHAQEAGEEAGRDAPPTGVPA